MFPKRLLKDECCQLKGFFHVSVEPWFGVFIEIELVYIIMVNLFFFFFKR